MKPTVYLETSVPSYFAARDSTDVIILAHQHITREWWEGHIPEYEVYVSDVVHDEIAHGDPDAARRRLDVIRPFRVLNVTDRAVELAEEYLEKLPLPQSALADALHLAVASIHGIQFLVTWNCRHIARGSVKRLLPSINAARGFASPTICTPEELLYEDYDVD